MTQVRKRTRAAKPAPVPASLLVERRDGVLRLRLARPAKLNALDHALIEGLLATIESARGDDEVRVVVVTGEGRAFCAGIDLDEVRALSTRSAIAAHAGLVARLQSAFRDIDKPVICAAHGYAFGAGCGLVAASDIAIAARSARFGYPEVRRDVLPALVLPTLVRQVGRKAAFHLAATGAIDAATAATLGLVTQVVDDADLEDATSRLAAELASRDPRTLAALKRLFARSRGAVRRRRCAARAPRTKVRSDNVRAGRRVGPTRTRRLTALENARKAMAYEQILYSVDAAVATITFNRPEKLNACKDPIPARCARDQSRDRRQGVRHRRHGRGPGILLGRGHGPPHAAQRGGKWRRVWNQQQEPYENQQAPAALRASRIRRGAEAHRRRDQRPLRGGGPRHRVLLRRPHRERVRRVPHGVRARGTDRGARHRVGAPAHRGGGRMDLLLSSRKVGAGEAKAIGLVTRVVPDADLASDAAAYARDLGEKVSPRSVRVMKHQVWQAQFTPLADALELANSELAKSFGTDDFREAGVVARRKANFVGS